jgi:hypothetical protein
MKKIIFALGLILGMTSCSSWLDEEPKSVAAETFYNTEAEAASAVLAPLNKLRNGYNHVFFPGMQEAFSDCAYARASWAQLSEYQGFNTTNISRSNIVWMSLYQSVRDCNIAINRLPSASSLTDQQKNAYIAELRFIRAFDYYNLVRLYGACPLRTDENMSEYNLAKSSVDDIYNYILADLTFATQNAPEASRIVGTPNKYSALSLLSEVYLQLGKYSEAASTAKQVIDSGKYSLVSVSTSRDFDKIFGPNVVTTSEEVFYLKNDNSASGYGWVYVMFCSHPAARINGQKMHGAGGWYGIYTTDTNSMISEWDVKDLRKDFNLLSFNLGLGFNTYLLSKFYDPNAKSDSGAGNDFPVIRYPDVLFVYAEATTKATGAPNADAMEKLNMIHRRAYGYTPTATSPVDYNLAEYNTTDKFMDILIKEQAYECMNEGKRWMFLTRLGIAKSQIKKIKGIDVADKHMLWPIPETEFNYNEALDATKDQNPGY